MSSALCFINNRFLDYDDARIHISDLGLQRGFGIFDYFLEMNGRIPFFNDYLDRFYNSAKRLGMDVPLDRDILKEKIAFLLQQNKFGSSGIKLLLTGGYSEDLYSPSKANFLIINMPLKYDPCAFGDGVKLLMMEYKRWWPEVKTTYYLPSLIMFQKLKETGAIEILYNQNGLLSETTRANIFLIRDNKLITPKNEILKGITREHVLKVAENIMDVDVRDVRTEEIGLSEEVFITGTSKHVMPVIAIDGQVIGDGMPGKMTRVISAAFEEYYSKGLSQKLK